MTLNVRTISQLFLQQFTVIFKCNLNMNENERILNVLSSSKQLFFTLVSGKLKNPNLARKQVEGDGSHKGTEG